MRGKTGVWRETSSQFRVISGAFFSKEKKSKTKMSDLPETSSQFRGLLRAQINEKILGESGSDFSRTGVWAETSSQFRRLAGIYFCFKNLKNGRFAWDVLTILQTDTVVESIVCVSKTDVLLETSSRFRFQMCPKMKNILIFIAENKRFAWDVLTISRSLRSFF